MFERIVTYHNKSGKMKILIEAESFKLARVFTISRGSKTAAHVLTVVLTSEKNDPPFASKPDEVVREGVKGRGECLPYT
jgi:hypothetical protein